MHFKHTWHASETESLNQFTYFFTENKSERQSFPLVIKTLPVSFLPRRVCNALNLHQLPALHVMLEIRSFKPSFDISFAAIKPNITKKKALNFVVSIFFFFLQKISHIMAKLDVSSQKILLKRAILGLIAVVAFSSRLFSIVRYESIIHEFDPW